MAVNFKPRQNDLLRRWIRTCRILRHSSIQVPLTLREPLGWMRGKREGVRQEETGLTSERTARNEPILAAARLAAVSTHLASRRMRSSVPPNFGRAEIFRPK